MSNEYDNYDFGFTTVDEEVYVQQQEQEVQIETEASEQVASAVTEEVRSCMNSIESKLETLIDKFTTEDQDFPADGLDVTRIEEKLDQILALENTELAEAIQGQGESIRAIIDEVEERKQQLNAAWTERMEEIKKLTLPLLYNLKKNPEREYIKWPNRVQIIDDQIKKINEVADGEVPYS